MTAPYRKKLIEVALPLKAINEASAREKSIRHGHPSTLHLWWARRPLAACRAVLFASLVDDPDSDPMFAGNEELAAAKRAELFNLIEELVRWENSNNPRVINAARAEIARCVASRKIELGELKKEGLFEPQNSQSKEKKKRDKRASTSSVVVTFRDFLHLLAPPDAVNDFLAEHGPPVLDPFCGGGSIPLETQRLGLRAYGSDLNPVPVLITKALIEIPPKFAGRPPVNPDWQKKSKEEKAATTWRGAQGLAKDVRYYGKWMRDQAEKRIGHLYPKVKITEEIAKDRPDLRDYVGHDLTVIAWLWARTVTSPNPAAHSSSVPLVRSFWLSKRNGKEAYVVPVVSKESTNYSFNVRIGKPEFGYDPGKATVDRSGAKCLITGAHIPLDYVRAQGKEKKLSTRLMAIVAHGRRGRVYLSPVANHEDVAASACPDLEVLETSLPTEALGFRVQNYGMTRHVQLFPDRSLLALSTFSDLIADVHDAVLAASDDLEYANAIATYLAFAVGRGADKWASLTVWNSVGEKVEHVFGRNALSMTWDFPECNIFSDSTGNWESGVEWVSKAVEVLPATTMGDARQLPAQDIELNKYYMFSTDPPYYDNVPYADLSDFFYVWIRRCLYRYYPSLLRTLLVPKSEELVAEPFRHGSRDAAKVFFEKGMQQVFERVRATCEADYPTTIYYAFKQAESDQRNTGHSDDGKEPLLARASTGWETFVRGLLEAGWQICGTWPLRTERAARLRGQLSNALASSIVLVCRPRRVDAPLATRKEFINYLRNELPQALRNLQYGNIAPVDLAQASIGPGMAVFTRYAKVMESDGSPMTVRTALGIINQVLDEVLAEQEGDFDADTRWALAWFEQFGTQEGAFGIAETLSKAKNTAVSGLVEAGIITARGGKVKLLARNELPENWDPTTDKRLTVWESTQHLIRTLDKQGESGTAALMNKLGGMAETARELAYRLYTICERKKWADEALAYNGLVIVWPELTKLAMASRNRTEATQSELF